MYRTINQATVRNHLWSLCCWTYRFTEIQSLHSIGCLDSLFRPRFMQEVAVAEQLLQPQQFHRSPIADVTQREGGWCVIGFNAIA
jgi:hypothetical protein